MEEAKQNIKQKKDSYNLRIVSAVLVLTVLVLGEFYVMINYPENYVALIVLTVVALADIYILIASAIQKNYKKEIDQYEQYDNLFKSEKASYLVTRKSFEDIADQLDRIEEAAGSPTKDIIDAQKSIAKVTISRNKENSDALMNSNDKLLEQIFNLSDRLDSLERSMLEQQRIVTENANKDLLLKQQEMAASIKEMELSIRNTILSELGKINYVAAPAATPVYEAPASIEEPAAPVEEPAAPAEEPAAPVEEPAAPEENLAAPFEEAVPDETVAGTEDDILDLNSLFGNEEEAPEASEPEMSEPEASEPEIGEPEVAEPEVSEPEISESEETLGFGADEPLGFVDEEESEPELKAEEEPEISIPEEPAFTEEMVNTLDEPVVEEVQETPEEKAAEEEFDPNHMMTPEEIAALIANAGAAAEEEPVVTEDAISEESEPVTAEPEAVADAAQAESEPVVETNSDPNHMMTPEEIAALFANL